MEIMSIAIGEICTVLMFGAVIWILVLERGGNDEPENSKGENRKNSNEKAKEGKH